MVAVPKSLGSGSMPSPPPTPPPTHDDDDLSYEEDLPMPIARKSLHFKASRPDRWTDTLEKLMKRDADTRHLLNPGVKTRAGMQNQHLIFLHPEDGNRDYTDEELKSSVLRDFETRLFIASTSCGGNSVFLRTRHSDNHPHATGIYNFVRDYLKASNSTKSFTTAKSALTRLLTIAFDANESDYCTFATTMASGLSLQGSNSSFEKGSAGDVNAMLRFGEKPDILQRELCILMHIVFTKLQKHNFMLEGGSNVYRLFHCRSKTSRDKYPVYIAIFTFCFQITLTVYVFLQLLKNFRDDVYVKEDQEWKIPLAVCTLFYSTILAWPIMTELPDGFKIFGSYGVLQTMDFIINGIVPPVLTVSGFFAIWGQDEFIDAVLNTAALLFIPMIDDDLPQLLGFRIESIVKNFLIHEAMEEFDRLHYGDDLERMKLKKIFYDDAKALGMGVQFADHHITNSPEEGSSHSDGILFQPYQVTKGKNAYYGDQIDPSSFITENCLIRKITWKYTVFKPRPNTSQPRVGYLKIEMLNGQIVEFERVKEKNIGLTEEYFLKGVYMITCFQISSDVLRLRVCGSKTARDFETALDYYALWPMSRNAKRLLKYHYERSQDLEPLLHDEHQV